MLTSPGAVDAAPPPVEAWTKIASSMGWHLGGKEPVTLASLRVRGATSLQLLPHAQKLILKHEVFVRDAWPNPDEVPDGSMVKLRETLSRLWKLKWENEFKEPMWRLAVDGFPGFSLHRNQLGSSNVAVCPCGEAMHRGDRRHHFYDCCISRSLWVDIQETAGIICNRHNLWLAIPPEGMSPLVWDVVCLSATRAMERGRRHLYANRDEDNLVSVAVRNSGRVLVVAEFWAGLRSFAEIGIKPKGWDQVGPDHPFLFSDQEGRVCAMRPDGIVEDLEEED
jgi:hypothetical protein